MTTTYLITGGAGFIGSHLTDALLAGGERVIVLDDLSTGRLANLAHLEGAPNLRVVIGSVSDALMVDDLVHEADVVVHLAAAVGVKLIIEQPLRSFTTNIRGSEIVINAAHRYRRKILIASTLEIYGKNGGEKLTEDSDRHIGPPTVARWAYSEAKAVDEILALTYHRERQLPAIVVRFFNTVGPRQTGQYGMVVPTFVRQALMGEPITVFGDGNQQRSFTYVGDVVGALLKLMVLPAAIGQVFNVGNTEEVTIRGLAERIKAATGSASEIVTIPYDQAYEEGFEDMPRRVPDLAKIEKAIGYVPQVGLDEIISRVVAEKRSFAGSNRSIR